MGNAGADATIVETDVSIETPDGTCDAAFIHPASGPRPAVIVWTDAFGLRPFMRDLAKRLASDGYAVLVPNPFYRVAKAPVFTDARSFDFSDTTQRARLTPLMGSITAEGAAERDSVAFILWLEHQPPVDRSRKIGTQGYCMGGALALRTAAAVPHRIGAAASFHGGGLVTDQPNSPHLLAPKIRAQVYIAIAANDDQRQPGAKETLRQAFAAAHVTAAVDVYSSMHGWCVADMPAPGGQPIYNQADAEHAWAKLLQLYGTALS
jgi:carboxymethylenebutenolidase